MHVKKIALTILVIFGFVVAGFYTYQTYVVNPNIDVELHEDPQGERAKKVMLIKLPDVPSWLPDWMDTVLVEVTL